MACLRRRVAAKARPDRQSMPEERPQHQGRPPDRPGGFAGGRPFRPGPRPDAPGPLVHTLRVREGDREIEVSGSALFVRQVLDDLDGVWARLRGETPPGPASIRMPQLHAPEDETETVSG